MTGKAWRTSQPESASVLKDFFLAQGKGSPGHLLNGGDVGFNKLPEEFRFGSRKRLCRSLAAWKVWLPTKA